MAAKPTPTAPVARRGGPAMSRILDNINVSGNPEITIGAEAVNLPSKYTTSPRIYVPRKVHFSPQFIKTFIGLATNIAWNVIRKALREKGEKVTTRLRGYRDKINELTSIIAKDLLSEIADKLQDQLIDIYGIGDLVNKYKALV